MSQYYVIKSKLTGFVLTAEHDGHRPSSRVTPQQQNGQDNQIFYDDPSTGTIRIKTSNFCLDIEDERLVVRPYQQGDPNQQWVRAEPHIRNKVDSNRVLDVFGENKDKGAQVGAYKFNGNANQCWTFEYTGGAHHAGGGPAAYPSQYPAYPGYPSQTPQQPQSFPKREFFIVSEMHKMVLDVTNEDTNPGAKVIMWKKHKEPKKNQLWYTDPRGFIRSSLNDFALSNPEYGKPIELQPYREDARRQWKFDGKKIVNGAGEVLDIAGKDDDKGAEVISYEYKDQKNQHWVQEFI